MTADAPSDGPGTEPVRVSADLLARQIEAIFRGWNLAEEVIAPSVEIMVETDLAGIDSHGVALLLYYEDLWRRGDLNPQPNIRVVRETPVTALIDGDCSLGYAVALRAIDLACDKAEAMGVGLVVARRSDHYGAAGAYVSRAARRGLLALTMTNGWTRCVVPAGAVHPMFSTNPLGFAAPAAAHPPFMFDVSTSTASIGKVNLAWLANRPIPEGWVVDGTGHPVTDAAAARDIIYNRPDGGLTPLGGRPEMSAHKGYGLTAMVEILAALLPGATAAPIQEQRPDGLSGTDTGHFFLAIDPKAFRAPGAFEVDLDAMIDALHACPPADPVRPVEVHGDRESAVRARRIREGIPIPPKLRENLRRIARDCGADCLF